MGRWLPWLGQSDLATHHDHRQLKLKVKDFRHPGEGPKVERLPAGFSQRLSGSGKVEIICSVCHQVVASI
jgi:hypothetical protein